MKKMDKINLKNLVMATAIIAVFSAIAIGMTADSDESDAVADQVVPAMTVQTGATFVSANASYPAYAHAGPGPFNTNYPWVKMYHDETTAWPIHYVHFEGTAPATPGTYNIAVQTGSGSGQFPIFDVTMVLTVTSAPVEYTHIVVFNKNTTDPVSYLPGALHATNNSQTYQFTIPSGIPQRSGYSFVEWRTQSVVSQGYAYQPGGTITTVGTTDASTSITLYAIWTPSGLQTLSFDINGGTLGTIASQSIMAGVTINLPTSGFTRPGYFLSGWRDGSAGMGTAYNLGAAYIMGLSTTMYAQWTALPTGIDENAPTTAVVGQLYSYTPSMIGPWQLWQQANIWSSLSGYSVNILSKPSWMSINYNTYPNITFSGTPTSPGAVTVQVQITGPSIPGNPITPTNTLRSWVIVVSPTATAGTEYQVTYNGNGGIGSVPSDSHIPPNNAIILPSGGHFTRQGYTQVGWTVNVNGVDSIFALGSAFTVTGNKTALAAWVPNANIAVFNANGGVGTIDPYIATTDSQITLPAAGFTRSGHTLEGWYLSTDSSVIFPKGFIYTISGSVTFYAYWIQNGTSVLSVTINANGGTGGFTQTVESGKKIVLPSYGITKSGSTLTGWSNTSGGAVNYERGETVTIAASKTFYAVWGDASEFVTVSFNLNSGSGSIPSQTFAVGGTATEPSTNPTRSANVFNGWFVAGGGPWTNWATPVNSDMTLVAQWLQHFAVTSSGTVATVTVSGSFVGTVTINWGDGTSETIYTAQAVHDYGAAWAGTITVTTNVGGTINTSSLAYAVSPTSTDGQEGGGGTGGDGPHERDPEPINWTFWILLILTIIIAVVLLLTIWPALFIWLPVMAAVLWWVF